MVLEIISPSSTIKDTAVLRDLYWRAGIREFWLVDARRDEPDFQILRHTDSGYTPVAEKEGWLRSAVFERLLKLTVAPDEDDDAEYTLWVR